MAKAASALLYAAGGGIGDSLIASVVGRALRRRFAVVDALTLPGHVETLQRVPDIDDVLADVGEEEAVAQRLRRRGYDACIVTWATARTARIAQRAGIPVRVGQARRLYSFRFTHQVTVRSEIGDVTTHWSQILLDYARALGCDIESALPHFLPTEADAAQAQHLLDELQLCDDRFALLHAANAVATRRGMWPTGGWAALARALKERFAVPVLLSGSARDAPIVERIARASGAIPIAGRLPIGAFGALAARSRIFAGITTGTMHVAAAAGAATVGIFPFQTATPDRWGPLGPRTALVRASYPCRAGERKETCPDYACIANLDVTRICTAIDALLSR